MMGFPERRHGKRAAVDLPTATYVDGFWHDCRLVDLSTTGLVMLRTPSLVERPTPDLSAVVFQLDGMRPVKGRTRTVWTAGALCAQRFVSLSDVDRLVIAEHLDRLEGFGRELH